MNDKTLSIVIRAQDEASKVMAGVGDGLEKVGDATLKYAKLAAIAFGAAATAATGFAIKSAADFEQTRIGLENMLGSADNARRVLSEVSKFAAETPFEFPELAGAVKQLVAFGFTGDDAVKTMKQLGDVSAAVGAPIGDVAYLMGTLRTQGRAFTVDIRQFAQRGIPIYEYLAKTMKTTEANVTSLIESGKVGFPEVQKAFEAMTGEGGKFHGAMAAQSKSLSGLWSTLKDSIGQAGRELVGINQEGDIMQGSLLDRLKTLATDILPMVENASKKIGPAVSKAMDTAINGVRGFWEASKGEGTTSDGFVGFMETLGVVANSIGKAFKTYLLPSISALGRSFKQDLGPSLSKIVPYLDDVAKIIGGVLVAALWVAINLINVFIKGLAFWVNAFFAVKQAIGDTINAIATFYQNVRDGVISAYQTIRDTITAVVNGVKQVISAAVNYIGAAFMEMYNSKIKPVVDLIVGAWNVLASVVGYVFAVIRGLALVAWWAIYNEAVRPVIDAISAGITVVKDTVVGAWQWIHDTAVAIWQSIFSTAIAPILNAISAGAQAMKSTLDAIWSAIANRAVGIWQGIYGTIRSVFDSISGYISSVWDKLTGGGETAALSLKNVFAGVANGIKNVFKDSLNWVINKLNDLIKAVNSSAGRLPGVPNLAMIPAFASGTSYAPGGLALVGERGPELVNLPRGSRVSTADQTKSSLSGSTFNMYGNFIVDSEARAQQVIQLLNKQSEMANLGAGV